MELKNFLAKKLAKADELIGKFDYVLASTEGIILSSVEVNDFLSSLSEEDMSKLREISLSFARSLSWVIEKFSDAPEKKKEKLGGDAQFWRELVKAIDSQVVFNLFEKILEVGADNVSVNESSLEKSFIKQAFLRLSLVQKKELLRIIDEAVVNSLAELKGALNTDLSSSTERYSQLAKKWGKWRLLQGLLYL